MRKHMAYVEKSNNSERFTQNDRHHLTARSTRSYHPPPASGGVYYKDNGLKTQRTLPPPQSSERQHIQTIHIPKALVTAPFLQHSALTPGQKRYLCSIAKVYSTEHIRRVMQQHYLNVLHRCIDTGHHPLSEIRNEDVNLHLTGKQRMDSDRSTDSKHSTDGSLGAMHSGKIILPKISNKQTRKALSTSASNGRKSRKRRTNVSMAQSRSVRGRKRRANLTKRQTKTGEEFLCENINSLSIKEKHVSKT